MYDYVRYISRIKDNRKKGMSKEEVVNEAVDWAISENLLDGFFKMQKEEILGMSLTEYDEEAVKRTFKEEGREEGIQQKALQDAINLLKNDIPVETISKCIGLPLEQVQELQKSITA